LFIQSSFFIEQGLSNQFQKVVTILANKTDLRFIKTEKLIENTYLNLRRKYHRPIKVRELCQEAMINKTTFYSHYETMESLHAHICEKEVGRIVESCPDIDTVFSDTGRFVRSLVSAVQDCSPIMDALFYQDTLGQINAVETVLLKYYLKDSVSPGQEMKMVFAIGGAAKLLIPEQSEQRIQMAIHLIAKVLQDDE